MRNAQQQEGGARRGGLIALAGLLAGLLLAAACTASPATPSTPGPSPQPTQPEPTATAPTATAPVTATPRITLTIWWPDALPSDGETPSGGVLRSQLDAFQEANPNIAVELRVKRAAGSGGLLQLLQSTYNVAPAALPELVVLDSEGLGEAMQAGVLQPLDALLPPTLFADMYPFALSIGRLGESQLALQFSADVEHLAYNTRKMPTAPVTWADVLSGTTRYLFPAAGQQGRVNRAFVIQYLALGGRLVDDSEKPALDEKLLAQALGFYAKGMEQKVIPARVLEMDSLDQCWESFIGGGGGMANVMASRYLNEREAQAEV
ncbi:MAG: hypothetical protein GX605_13565, partial [Chloroflexi bacterium]|nr:hypothetical protein [Chloroflexota bacterium]